jgi:hypothetical protein
VLADHTPDPAIVAVVDEVTNRFGVDGLDALVTLAEARRVAAEQALAALADLAPER